MRAAIAAETAGIPSVSIVCEGFAGQAYATGRGYGFDDIALAETIGHVDAQSTEAMVSNFLESTVDQVIRGLMTADDQGDGNSVSAEPAALDVALCGSIDEINVGFRERGWTDGHPVIPPSVVRVETFLGESGHDPWKVLGVAPSSGRDVTVWSIGVNAVMAGCDPQHLPVLMAITEALLDPTYGAEHSGNTTGADALVVLSGPTGAELGFNHGAGALREGTHANTSVGRWLRLYLRNVFGFTGDTLDKATFGNSARVVLAEDNAALTEIGWSSLAEDLGTEPGTDAISIARLNSGTIIGSVFGSTPEEIAPYLGNGIARTAAWDLTHVYGLGHDQFAPLLVLSPILSRLFANAGMSKGDVSEMLFEHARIPAVTFESMIGQWSNLTAGRRTLVDLVADGLIPEVFAESDDPARLVPIVTRPERLLIAVAGDPHRTNAYAFSNDGPHGWWTTKPIDFEIATDLLCQVPDRT